MSVPLIFLVKFIILFSKPTSHYYFQPIIIMSLPQPHDVIYNFTVAPKSQHYYLVPIRSNNRSISKAKQMISIVNQISKYFDKMQAWKQLSNTIPVTSCQMFSRDTRNFKRRTRHNYMYFHFDTEQYRYFFHKEFKF